MSSLTEQVVQEFRDAARWRGCPVPDLQPRLDIEQDVAAICRAALRRVRVPRIVHPRP